MSQLNVNMVPFCHTMSNYNDIGASYREQQVIGSQQQQLGHEQQLHCQQANPMQQINPHAVAVNANEQYPWYPPRPIPAMSRMQYLHSPAATSQQFIDPPNMLASWPPQSYSPHYSHLHQRQSCQPQSQQYMQHLPLTLDQFRQYPLGKQQGLTQPQSKHQVPQHSPIQQVQQKSPELSPRQNSSSKQQLQQSSPLEQQIQQYSPHNIQQLSSPNQQIQYSPTQQLQQQHVSKQSSPLQQDSPLPHHVQLESSQKQHVQQDTIQWMNTDNPHHEIGNKHSTTSITANMNSTMNSNILNTNNNSTGSKEGTNINGSVTNSINGSINGAQTQPTTPSPTSEDFQLTDDIELRVPADSSIDIFSDIQEIIEEFEKYQNSLGQHNQPILYQHLESTSDQNVESTPVQLLHQDQHIQSTSSENMGLTSSTTTPMEVTMETSQSLPRFIQNRSPIEWMRRPSYQSQPNPGM